MKITGFKIDVLFLPLRDKPRRSAYRQWPSGFNNVLFHVETDEGIVGLGEAPCEEFYYGETREHVVAGLRLIGETIMGMDPRDIGLIHQIIERSVLSHATLTAKYAMDTALYDILGKQAGMPIYKLLQHNYRTEFPLCAHVYHAPIEETLDQVRMFIDQGYRGLEIKCLGIHDSIKSDIQRLTAVLKEVNDDILVIGDVNQSWLHPKTAANALNANFRGVSNLQMEQPVHYLNLEGLASLTAASEIPIIADEAIFSPEIAYQIIRVRGADVINVKIARLGGIYKALKVITAAELAGIEVRLDIAHFSEIGDTVVGHLASACSYCPPVACDARNWFARTPVKAGTGLQLDNGTGRLSSAPGLGIELDLDAVAALSVNS